MSVHGELNLESIIFIIFTIYNHKWIFITFQGSELVFLMLICEKWTSPLSLPKLGPIPYLMSLLGREGP